jgi:hypothetical protein
MNRLWIGLTFGIVADGTSTSQDVNLLESPISLPVTGKIPSSVSELSISGLSGYTWSLTGTILTISFPKAPAAGLYNVAATVIY